MTVGPYYLCHPNCKTLDARPPQQLLRRAMLSVLLQTGTTTQTTWTSCSVTPELEVQDCQGIWIVGGWMNKETSQQIQDYPKINCLPSLKAINWAWLGLADSTSTSCRLSSSAFSGAVGQYSPPSSSAVPLLPLWSIISISTTTSYNKPGLHLPLWN